MSRTSQRPQPNRNAHQNQARGCTNLTRLPSKPSATGLRENFLAIGKDPLTAEDDRMDHESSRQKNSLDCPFIWTSHLFVIAGGLLHPVHQVLNGNHRPHHCLHRFYSLKFHQQLVSIYLVDDPLKRFSRPTPTFIQDCMHNATLSSWMYKYYNNCSFEIQVRNGRQCKIGFNSSVPGKNLWSDIQFGPERSGANPKKVYTNFLNTFQN